MSIFKITGRLITKRKYQALALLFGMASPACAQKLAMFEVTLERSTAGLDVPVQVMLDPITTNSAASLSLIELQGSKRVPVPFQMDAGPERKLTWMVNDNVRTRRYELVKGETAVDEPLTVNVEKKSGSLTIKAGDKNLLRYQYETLYPPKGVDAVFKRNAFIHPLWSPKGQVLTRIQPPDHYHHYGLWNPWTHVRFEDDTVDFWNLNARQGTVRFADFSAVTSGHVFGEYAAIHEHVAFPGQEKEKVAMKEIQTVRVYAPQGYKDHYTADITVELTCPGSPVRLLEYRYGGMGWRATEQWTKENSNVLSSEGKTRKDADGSRARWCIAEGLVDGENAGAVMMSFPENYNYPEPLRIWPENANHSRGDMFANFSPTKDRDWQLEPGVKYTLRYRFVVFNGTFSAEKAEAAWHYFANPPVVKVLKP